MKMQQGFTLVEIMIVVVIIGILSSIGFPAYTDYVTRGKVVQATSGLSDGRIKMEQFFQDNRTYAAGTCPAANEFFSFVCDNLSATTYTITATGTPSNLTDFSYSIDQDNVKRSTTPWSNGAEVSCWIMKEGDSC
ncbi:MAG: type IV pilin protein [Gallionella sp.]|nr:type IV pilin protein [Gallionella sp.]